MPDPRSVWLPSVAEPLLVGPGIYVSHYADLTRSHANDLYTTGPLLSASGLRHVRYPNHQPDSAGTVERFQERIYVTVSAFVEDTFPATSTPPCLGDCTADVIRPTVLPLPSAATSSAPAAGVGTSPSSSLRRCRFTCPRSRMRTITSWPV